MCIKDDPETCLLAKAVSNDLGFLERCIFVKCIGKNVVRDIIAEITDE